MDRQNEYIIGLDIGTNGVGWSVTDDDGRLLKAKGRHMFGYSKFDEADTAEERSRYRHQRRRRSRIKLRLSLLQKLLTEDISRVDEDFIHRIDEASMDSTERTKENIYRTLPPSLYTDGSLVVREKGKKTLPIYKIRESLVNTKKEADIRYVYMAIAHILKHRGLFLNESVSEQTEAEMCQEFAAFLFYINDNYFTHVPCDIERISKFINMLTVVREEDRQIEETIRIFSAGEDTGKVLEEIVRLLNGETVELNHVFKSKKKICQVSFGDMDSVDIIDTLPEDIADEVQRLADIYEWKENKCREQETVSLSEEMNARYERHKEDLRQLKKWIRKYMPDEYERFFHSDNEKINYNAYVHSHTGSSSGAKQTETSWNSCSQESFYAHVSDILNSCHAPAGQKEASGMLQKMYDENGNMIQNGFLPLQRIRLNNTIRNRSHLAELEKILENQSEYYPTIKENKDKILCLCTYRLPVYVGPLRQGKHSPFAPWVEYRTDSRERILPWELDDRINIEKTAENWITNATNECTFVPGDKVLPKHSLLYEEYMLLNELNAMNVVYDLEEAGVKTEQQTMDQTEDKEKKKKEEKKTKVEVPIDGSLKENLINEYFRHKKRPTMEGMLAWLKEQKQFRNKPNLRIEAGSKRVDRLSSRLSTLFDVERILGHRLLAEEDIARMEDMVRWSTVYADRNIYKDRLRREFKDIYSEEQIRQFEGLRYRGWGKLGKRILTDPLCSVNGKKKSVMEILRTNHETFMRIYWKDSYKLRAAICELQGNEQNDCVEYAMLENIHCSPSLKRGVWHSVKIIEELKKYMGHEPSGIYLRNMREANKEKTKEIQMSLTRYTQVKELYAAYDKGKKRQDRILPALKTKLQSCKKAMTDAEYLYLTQFGKCMYTGEDIDLNDPSSYMIDHVIPQYLSMDETFNNRVLVKKNARVSKMPLPKSVIREMNPFWTALAENGMIPGAKLRGLQTEQYTEETAEYYLSKQLTDNSLIIERLTSLLGKCYPDCRVVGLNTILIDKIRDALTIKRVRSLSEMQRAYEAFLVAHIGAFMQKFYPSLAMPGTRGQIQEYKKIKEHDTDKNCTVSEAYKKPELINKEIKDKETDEVKRVIESCWITGQERMDYARKVCTWHDGFVTYKPHEYTGKFFRETLYRHVSEDNLINTKHGDHHQVYIAHMALISYRDKHGEYWEEVINVPAYVAALCKKGNYKEELLKYIETELGYNGDKYQKIKIIKEKILLNQEAVVKLETGESHPVYLKSATEWANAKQLHVKEEYVESIRKAFSVPLDAVESIPDDDWVKIEETAEYLAAKLQSEYPIYKSLNDSIQTAMRDHGSYITKEQYLLMIQIMVNSMNPGGERVKPIIEKLNLETKKEAVRSFLHGKMPTGLKSPITLTGDSRMNNKRLKSKNIVLVTRSITGLYTNTKR